MLRRFERAYAIPAALAFAGPAILVVATRGSFLPFACGWWLAALLFASIGRRGARIAIGLALLPVCVLTTFEGGLFMLPAVIATLLIDLSKARASDAAVTRRHASP